MRPKFRIYWIIIILLNYFVIEGTSYGTLYFLKKLHNLDYQPVDVVSDKHRNILNQLLNAQSKYITYSSSLGWTIKQNGASNLYQANSAGIRSDTEYDLRASREVFRLAAFGDSFTHCDDVGNSDTWQAVMETLDPRLEVLNFGVGGFGLDQAYLRYLEEGSQYQPDVVLIGFMPEDIFRHVNVFRPFYFPETGVPLTKPRFSISNDQDLTLIENPLSKLVDYTILLSHPRATLSAIGISDYYYRRRYRSSVFDLSPTVRLTKIVRTRWVNGDYTDGIIVNGYYDEKSEAFRVTTRLLDYFYTAVIRNNSIPVILIFPAWEDIDRYRSRKTKRYFPLLSYFNSKGYRYVDLMDVFANDYEVNELVTEHYTPLGNKLVAERIHSYLRVRGDFSGRTKAGS